MDDRIERLRPPAAPPLTPAGQRLLEAASALFYERGIAAVGVDLVAEHAGTTKRTLYQRFGSKDALVATYLAERARQWQNHVLDRLSESAPTSIADAVDVVLVSSGEWSATGRRGCAFVNAWAEIGHADHPGVAVIADEKRWMRRLLTELIGNADVAAQVHLVHEGALVAATTMGDPDAFTTARRLAAHLAG